VLDYAAGWIAIDKPAGHSVHNDSGSDLRSRMASFFSSHPDAAQAVRFDPEFGIHPLHRLDKATSGVMLLACQRQLFLSLARLFSERKIAKRYLAVVHGHLATPRGGKWALWKWPLSQKAGGRRSPAGPPPRQNCRTRYRVKSHTPQYTIIECEPFTGRTHQIRRHVKMAGHTILGDRRYGTLRAARYLEEQHGFTRLALHAQSLTFRCPVQKIDRTLHSAGLPSEIQALVNRDIQPEMEYKKDAPHSSITP
jgi:23S rRNA-/tRNA-specific pseudouridylate synthase